MSTSIQNTPQPPEELHGAAASAQEKGFADSMKAVDAFSADGDVLCRTHIGGQALIEGVMMRGRYNWAVGIREPDGGIYTE